MRRGELQGVQEPDRLKTVLKNRKRSPIPRIRGECDCKTAAFENNVQHKTQHTNAEGRSYVKNIGLP